jgi:hypothetical protein
MIKTPTEAIVAYAKIWAWVKLASIYFQNIGMYPAERRKELALYIKKEWEKIDGLSRDFAHYLKDNEEK